MNNRKSVNDKFCFYLLCIFIHSFEKFIFNWYNMECEVMRNGHGKLISMVFCGCVNFIDIYVMDLNWNNGILWEIFLKWSICFQSKLILITYRNKNGAKFIPHINHVNAFTRAHIFFRSKIKSTYTNIPINHSKNIYTKSLS